jgi:hypothetical protein
MGTNCIVSILHMRTNGLQVEGPSMIPIFHSSLAAKGSPDYNMLATIGQEQCSYVPTESPTGDEPRKRALGTSPFPTNQAPHRDRQPPPFVV